DGDDVGAVNLIAGDQPIGREIERRHRPGAVLGDLVGRVTGTETAIERAEQTGADAAGAGEEGMADAGRIVERGETDHRGTIVSAPGLPRRSPPLAAGT